MNLKKQNKYNIEDYAPHEEIDLSNIKKKGKGKKNADSDEGEDNELINKIKEDELRMKEQEELK
jgi:hypothetical protein